MKTINILLFCNGGGGSGGGKKGDTFPVPIYASMATDNADAESLNTKYKQVPTAQNKNGYSVIANDMLQYTSGEYRYINETLRTGDNSNGLINNKIASIDKSFALIPELKKPVIVYRGASSDIVKNAKVGDTVEDKAFMSTSLNQEKAIGFARNANGNKGLKGNGVVFELEVPKGMKAQRIGYEDGLQEHEVLLPRGTSFKVTKITTEKGIKTIHGEVIKQSKIKTEWSDQEKQQIQYDKNIKRLEVEYKKAKKQLNSNPFVKNNKKLIKDLAVELIHKDIGQRGRMQMIQEKFGNKEGFDYHIVSEVLDQEIDKYIRTYNAK